MNNLEGEPRRVLHDRATVWNCTATQPCLRSTITTTTIAPASLELGRGRGIVHVTNAQSVEHAITITVPERLSAKRLCQWEHQGHSSGWQLPSLHERKRPP
jgi:hypothetical protein